MYARQELIAAMTHSRVLWLDEEVITLLADLKPDSLEKISELLANETQVNMATGIELTYGKLVVRFESPQGEATQELLTRMLEVASQTTRVNAKRITPQEGEMKYYCHTWLMQLHMGGLDFKATRRHSCTPRGAPISGGASLATAAQSRENFREIRGWGYLPDG